MTTFTAQVNEKKSPPIKVTRPKWDDLYKNYPKASATQDMPADTVFTEIFGPNYDPSYNNACAARLSLALVKCDINIDSPIKGKVGIYKGKGIILSADKMKTWLSKNSVWGNPDITITKPLKITETDLSAKLDGKKGVYIMIPPKPKEFRATGHVTLWTGKQVIGSNYVTAAYSVFFWELK